MGVSYSQRQVVHRSLYLECKAGVPRSHVLGDSQFARGITPGGGSWRGRSVDGNQGVLVPAQRRPAGVPVPIFPLSMPSPFPLQSFLASSISPRAGIDLSVGTWFPFSSRLHLSEVPLLCEPCLSLPSESFYGPPPMFSVHQPYILFSAPSTLPRIGN